MTGTQIGDRIYGAEYVDDVPAFIYRIEEQYARALVWDPAEIPRGRQMHIGKGVWLRRCRACDDYLLSYGTAWNMTFGKHERAHGLDVVGINIGMLGG